jgi:hypothetical protein
MSASETLPDLLFFCFFSLLYWFFYSNVATNLCNLCSSFAIKITYKLKIRINNFNKINDPSYFNIPDIVVLFIRNQLRDVEYFKCRTVSIFQMFPDHHDSYSCHNGNSNEEWRSSTPQETFLINNTTMSGMFAHGLWN